MTDTTPCLHCTQVEVRPESEFCCERCRLAHAVEVAEETRRAVGCEMTRPEVARAMGISVALVAKLERRALRKLALALPVALAA